MTLRRLLSHSAGLTVHGFPGYAVTEPVPTIVQVLDGAKPANTDPVRVDIVPGSTFRYSGGGTTVVQLALVDQLGKPFPQILDETVLSKLGLKNSTYQQPLPPGRASQAATGHSRNGKAVEGRWHIYPEMAAAGLWTTAWDLAQIAIEVARSKAGQSTRVLSQDSVRLMLTAQAGEAGLGFFVDPSGKTDAFGHGGADDRWRDREPAREMARPALRLGASRLAQDRPGRAEHGWLAMSEHAITGESNGSPCPSTRCARSGLVSSSW